MKRHTPSPQLHEANRNSFKKQKPLIGHPEHDSMVLSSNFKMAQNEPKDSVYSIISKPARKNGSPTMITYQTHKPPAATDPKKSMKSNEIGKGDQKVGHVDPTKTNFFTSHSTKQPLDPKNSNVAEKANQPGAFF